jgi:uncharacterized protein YgbK (DUF1537 family)
MLAILADDLTGTLDSAAPFAGRGLYTEIALSLDAIEPALEAEPAVVSINLGSREIDPDAARQATRTALSRLPADTLLFKKIDSRLKGNIAAELGEMRFRLALVAPAIPDFGRLVRSGHVEGFGISTSICIENAIELPSERLFVPDTIQQFDMERALDQALLQGADLLVGARGLAEALACRMTGRRQAILALPAPGPTVFVIGSRDPITLAQVEELRSSMPLDYVPAPNGGFDRNVVKRNRLMLVQATPGDIEHSAQLVSDRLAAGVVPEITGSAATLVLSGGATAESVLKAMGVTGFRLLGECLPGLGLAYVNGQCIIAKSGGFGLPGTLCEIARASMGEKV